MIEGCEQDYEGQSDARSLKSAHEVRSDKKRHANALKHLKKMGKNSSQAMDAHQFESQKPDTDKDGD